MTGEKNKVANDEFFNTIYSQYYDFVYFTIKNILYSKVDDDITSCTQETFEKAWIKIDILKNHKNVAGWLVKTAKNVSYHFNEKYLTRQRLAGDSENMENIAKDEDFTQEIVEEALFEEYTKSNIAEKFLSRLSEKERQFYDLKFVEKLSNEKIGKILGISAHAVVVRSRRLIEKFKKDF